MQKKVRSRDIRKMREQSLERALSQSTIYYTPRNSPTSSVCSAKISSVSSLQSQNTAPLARSVSEPCQKPKSRKKGGLRRLVSCFGSQSDASLESERASSNRLEAEVVQPVAAPPRRLRSGGANGIDFLRFDQSDAQLREFYSPLVGTRYQLTRSASLPIPHQEVPLVNEDSSEMSSRHFSFVRNLQRLKRMSGVYQLDRSRSDSVKPMSDLLEFSWALRKAFENSDMMQIQVQDPIIKQTGRVFRMVDLAEELDLSGEEVTLKRRDLRKGPLFAKTFLTPAGYINKLHWNDPCAGGLVETFVFSEDGSELEIRYHVYRADGRMCNFKLVWNRHS